MKKAKTIIAEINYTRRKKNKCKYKMEKLLINKKES